jgi:hypothetical protein
MSPILDVLIEMRSRNLGMYVGSTSLTKLGFFLLGYEHAVYRLRPGEPDKFLGGFRDWIYQRFHTTENISWEEVILRHSSSEADAVERFWNLLDEYVAVRHRAVPAATIGGSCAPARPSRS